MARSRPGLGCHIVISTVGAEWRNLSAEWDWWLSVPDGATGAGIAVEVGIEDRGAVERAF